MNFLLGIFLILFFALVFIGVINALIPLFNYILDKLSEYKQKKTIKISKTMIAEDLKEDQIYSNKNWIIKFKEIINWSVWNSGGISKRTNSFYNTGSWSNEDSQEVKSLVLATEEEKQWLEACIKADKFVSKEEALELSNIIPEYVECLKSYTGKEVGLIYKIDDCPSWFKYCSSIKDFYEINKNTDNWFKSSTKEAFEAQNKFQFKVGKWYKNSNETYAKCKEVCDDKAFKFSEWVCMGKYEAFKGFDTAWSYHPSMIEVPDSEVKPYLPKEDKFKTGNWVIITSLGFAGGSAFSLNKPYKLTKDYNENNGFFAAPDNRGSNTNGWSNGYNLGIRIRYAFPHEIPSNDTLINLKKEINKEELAAEAKRRYPIGTRYICNGSRTVSIITDHNYSKENYFMNDLKKPCIVLSSNFGNVYLDGKWAEIIEFPNDKTSLTSLLDGWTKLDKKLIFYPGYLDLGKKEIKKSNQLVTIKLKSRIKHSKIKVIKHQKVI